MNMVPNSLSKLNSSETWISICSNGVLRQGKMLKLWNHTLIALVSKSTHATNVGDYRSISYCNIFYKVISKLLATRFEDIANEFLHPVQTKFVKGRLITDNIHLAQELLRNYSRKRISPRCILKVNLLKVFNDVH